jgi:hypothetical protein
VSDEARQHAAEQVREHLVTLRGGAPFLSPADGRLLGRWLDEATPVAAICLALERAVDARRKAPSRVPLSLTHAKRHLGKPGAAVVTGGVETTNAGHPLAPITVALRAGGDANRRELADHLEALPAGPEGSLGARRPRREGRRPRSGRSTRRGGPRSPTRTAARGSRPP